jgi:hypothetical protein
MPPPLPTVAPTHVPTVQSLSGRGPTLRPATNTSNHPTPRGRTAPARGAAAPGGCAPPGEEQQDLETLQNLETLLTAAGRGRDAGRAAEGPHFYDEDASEAGPDRAPRDRWGGRRGESLEDIRRETGVDFEAGAPPPSEVRKRAAGGGKRGAHERPGLRTKVRWAGAGGAGPVLADEGGDAGKG